MSIKREDYGEEDLSQREKDLIKGNERLSKALKRRRRNDTISEYDNSPLGNMLRNQEIMSGRQPIDSKPKGKYHWLFGDVGQRRQPKASKPKGKYHWLFGDI